MPKKEQLVICFVPADDPETINHGAAYRAIEEAFNRGKPEEGAFVMIGQDLEEWPKVLDSHAEHPDNLFYSYERDDSKQTLPEVDEMDGMGG